MGKSSKTDIHLIRHPYSSTRLHGEKLDCPFLADDFSIIDSANDFLELRIILYFKIKCKQNFIGSPIEA